jgi:ABC-type phosphate/phosphonate transport system substrate-binding protein
MSQDKTLLMGAVAYDPKVVIIWDGFRQYFAEQGLDFDYVLYSNYERQVESHLAGDIDVAWNSPLAWLQTKAVAERLGRRAQAICMRIPIAT